jgi:histidinol-phosphate phosphatase family protein
MNAKKRAIFLDKDGTLVEDIPYNVDPERITLVRGAGVGLRMLAGAEFELVVVSNQSGAARGYFKECQLVAVEARLRELLREQGVALLACYWCPHHPEGAIARLAFECLCRKPMPGMPLRAAAEHGIDLEQSWMVGDILNDIEAGRRAGCRTVLIDNGNETEWQQGPHRWPHFTAPDLVTAASYILAADQKRRELERTP